VIHSHTDIKVAVNKVPPRLSKRTSGKIAGNLWMWVLYQLFQSRPCSIIPLCCSEHSRAFYV